MDLNKLWLIGSVLVTSVIVVLGWLLGVQPQLDSLHAAETSRAAVQTTNTGHVALIARLKLDFENIDALAETADALAESVPTGSAMPDFVDQLDAQARAAGVTLTGMTVTEAQAYVPVAAPVAAPGTDTAAPATGEEAPALASTGPVASAPSLITASNFAAFPLQITVTGNYAEVLDFVASLQTGGRLFLVDGLGTVPAPGEPNQVDATISGLVYSLVAPAAASAG